VKEDVWQPSLTATVENILDGANILNILDILGILQFQVNSQCFHHSHFLDHCDSPGDLIDFPIARLRTITFMTITAPEPRTSVMKVFW